MKSFRMIIPMTQPNTTLQFENVIKDIEGVKIEFIKSENFNVTDPYILLRVREFMQLKALDDGGMFIQPWPIIQNNTMVQPHTIYFSKREISRLQLQVNGQFNPGGRIFFLFTFYFQ